MVQNRGGGGEGREHQVSVSALRAHASIPFRGPVSALQSMSPLQELKIENTHMTETGDLGARMPLTFL